MKRSIILTGGGTAGHVTPNIALLEILLQDGWDIHYIGSPKSIEENMIRAQKLPFYAIRCGKLRRYFSWRTLLEPFNIAIGMIQSYRIIRRLKPLVLFSKGGFVSFPAVVGAYLNKVPVVIHESDMSPGLANRLSFPFAKHICLTFPVHEKSFNKPVTVTGTPIRSQLFEGHRERALTWCGFSGEKPCLLVIGGSLGAVIINNCVREALDELCEKFYVIHICGAGKVDSSIQHKNYLQFEFVNDELADLLALSDVVISRAGANTVYEMLSLAKPHVFIPLSAKSSRGDQIENALYFQQQGISIVLQEEYLSKESLIKAIQEAYQNRPLFIEKIRVLNLQPAAPKILSVIHQVISRNK